MTTALRARGLRKNYGDAAALDGVDLDVATGEIFALLGPNGAGKSTAVEILEGLRDRDSGEVSVLGTDPARADHRWRARIGVVLQEARDFTMLRVGEAVRQFGSYYPAHRDPDEVLAAVGLTEQTRTLTSRLSGGQRRRLDVALGIVGGPELLFLDEPTTGFDPAARRQFWELIRSLRSSGTTVLLTTHYLDEAEALADRVGVLVRGRLVEVAAPERLGGRDRAEAVVTWEEDGKRCEQATPEPTRFIAELATLFHGEIPGLSVVRPSLEDIYLDLIGSESEHEGGR
ncbi:ABC transporter ATP-binding protein [Catenulispora yoronensis]|uniref:ABC transporter ATP-binding protein n=1 Tax=Catenulispora yoronensis TaxID=450799 RepID=A0ABP5F6F8_9ACTN